MVLVSVQQICVALATTVCITDAIYHCTKPIIILTI